MRIEDLTEKDLERFWSKVDKKGDDECWGWLGTIDREGYGNLAINLPDGRNTTRKAHRIMWSIYNEEIPKSMVVMHICDNPPCCNPKHLKLGTQPENVQDCVDKNRRAPQNCDNNSSRTLNSIQVLEIKRLYETGEYSALNLSKKFGVSPSTINYIIKGKSWKEITKEIKIPENKKNMVKSILSDEDVISIKNLLRTTNLSYKKIGKQYNITGSEVSLIARNKIWKNIGGDVDVRGRKRETSGTKLIPEDVIEIKQLIKEGKTPIKDIAEMFDITSAHVWWIKTEKSWADTGDNNFDIQRGKKLNSEEVKEIKLLLLDKTIPIQTIAEKFNVSTDNIYHIKQGKTWKDVII